MDLFADAGHERARQSAPLAARLRPARIDDVVGQGHLLAAGSPLRRLIEGGQGVSSLILYGPPGTGKTTLAGLVAQQTGRRFVELSAVTSGIKDVREAIERATHELGSTGRETVLFIDEVHRFNKTQQDALLPAVENRLVTLIAATTENPSFSVVSPLLSRSVMLTLHPLTDADIRQVLDRAMVDERGYAGSLILDDQAQDQLIRLSGGDARRALTFLEAAAGVAQDRGSAQVVPEDVSKAIDRALVVYDRGGDQHYDVASALIKSIRGSDVDAALHYLARMLEGGEDPRFIARRLIISASEDIGMADPAALPFTVAAAEAVAMIGMPEARITLGQAVVYLATAPKSNAAYLAINAAIADVQAGLIGQVPLQLRDSHYQGAGALGHGQGYEYPHDDERGVVHQQYAPDVLKDREYYLPTRRGYESKVFEALQWIRAILRGRDSGKDSS
jgi:putative ATPase